MKTISLRAKRYEKVAAEVFEPLQRYLFRRARPEEVEDLLSEVMLVVWRRLDEVPTSAALPWSYGVARNVLNNHRRSESRRLRLVERLESEPWITLHDEPTGMDAELEQALGLLNDEEKELVRLWAWEELEPREIAVVLSTTPNAISLRLARVKQKLASEMSRQSDGASGHIPGTRPDEHVGEM